MLETTLEYEKNPDEIYRQSFEMIEKEANLARFSEQIRKIIIRLIHSCAMVDIVDNIAFSENIYSATSKALQAGKPIVVDVEMVVAGIIQRFLPSNNQIICTLNNPAVRQSAKAIQTTRSAAAVELWVENLQNSIVVIGNAPTALFRLLEIIEDGGPKPAAILGFPVGFVGAVESKELLANNSAKVPFITLYGRRGGSAMACAALNAFTASIQQDQPK